LNIELFLDFGINIQHFDVLCVLLELGTDGEKKRRVRLGSGKVCAIHV
jgi:hypothetical protein